MFVIWNHQLDHQIYYLVDQPSLFPIRSTSQSLTGSVSQSPTGSPDQIRYTDPSSVEYSAKFSSNSSDKCHCQTISKQSEQSRFKKLFDL